MRILVILMLLAVTAGGARADGIATYAIIVGSNAGGPGQTGLRYAEDDARKMAALLTELGGYAADQVDVVLHPTPDELRTHLAALGDRVTADLAAGRQSRVFFYYSGHARASAIDLGDAELPLGELRQRLFQVPATLTIVVLDACQSGAFSRIKGARAAADFSVSSRQHLDASGVAVLASSSGSELSQESEQLHGSYFTHHLLIGLRGAGDANHDGQVSIDEAYRYAYHQTLLATAETAVGGQHVSLEVELKGHGEVPLSFPRQATSAIELPAALEGQTLVEDTHAHAVIAETYKAKGAAVRIAVAPGDYQVLVRHGTTLARCDVSGGGVVDLDHCRTEQIVAATTKGGDADDVPFRARWYAELAGTVGGDYEDGYIQTLKNFGYHDQGALPGLAVRVMREGHHRALDWIGGEVGYESSPLWSRETDGLYPLRFNWTLFRLMAVTRNDLQFGESNVGLYFRLAAGLGAARTTFRDQSDMTTHQWFFGPAASTGVGLYFRSSLLPGFEWSFGADAGYAPVIKNLTGDTHYEGGLRGTTAVGFTF